MNRFPLRFAATIKIRGINPYVEVGERRAARLRKCWRRPMPVRFRINGKPVRQPWRSNLMPAGNGAFYLYLHGSVRKASATRVGDRVTVELDFDHSYRNGPRQPMPRWLSAGLKAAPEATLNWRNLPPSRRKEIIRYFAHLKSPAARQRNLARAIAVLSGEPGRFMARDWCGGR